MKYLRVFIFLTFFAAIYSAAFAADGLVEMKSPFSSSRFTITADSLAGHQSIHWKALAESRMYTSFAKAFLP